MMRLPSARERLLGMRGDTPWQGVHGTQGPNGATPGQRRHQATNIPDPGTFRHAPGTGDKP